LRGIPIVHAYDCAALRFTDLVEIGEARRRGRLDTSGLLSLNSHRPCKSLDIPARGDIEQVLRAHTSHGIAERVVLRNRNLPRIRVPIELRTVDLAHLRDKSRVVAETYVVCVTAIENDLYTVFIAIQWIQPLPFHVRIHAGARASRFACRRVVESFVTHGILQFTDFKKSE